VGACSFLLIGAVVVADRFARKNFARRPAITSIDFAEVKIPFDFAENALTLLRRGEYAATARLPS